jgi:hypothetical protein
MPALLHTRGWFLQACQRSQRQRDAGIDDDQLQDVDAPTEHECRGGEHHQQQDQTSQDVV